MALLQHMEHLRHGDHSLTLVPPFPHQMALLQHMEHLRHGEHPHDYVINRTLVTTELVPPEEEVHTLELVDGEDGRLVMLVKGDGGQEMLLPDGRLVTADGQPISEADAPFLGSEVQYVTTDGQRLDLIIDEAGGGGSGGGGGGGGDGGSGGDGVDPAVDLVIEETDRDAAVAGTVDLILQDERGQLVLQGEQGQQLVLQQGNGEPAAEPGQWLLDAEDGHQIVLQGTADQLQLTAATAPFTATVPSAGV